MLVTFQAQASVTVEEAMAIHDEMKADADMRADISRSYRNFMRIWPNSVKRAERVLQQYYRIDAIRYKAQLAFESEYSIWYTSGLYRDSVKVEKKWLTLLNHVSTRLVIDNANQGRYRSPEEELELAKNYRDWTIEDEARAKENRESIDSDKKWCGFYLDDSMATVNFAKAEAEWAETAFKDQESRVRSMTEEQIAITLAREYKEADNYLKGVIDVIEEKRLVLQNIEDAAMFFVQQVMAEWYGILSVQREMEKFK